MRTKIDAKIHDLTLEIDIRELIEALPQEEREQFTELMTVSNAWMRAACDLLIDGRTEEHGFERYVSGESWLEPYRARVLAHANKVAHRALTEAITLRMTSEAKLKDFQGAYWNLWHAWPEYATQLRPDFRSDVFGHEAYGRRINEAKQETDAMLAERERGE